MQVHDGISMFKQHNSGKNQREFYRQYSFNGVLGGKIHCWVAIIQLSPHIQPQRGPDYN